MLRPVDELKEVELLDGSRHPGPVMGHIDIRKLNPFKGRTALNQTFPVGVFPGPDWGYRAEPGDDDASMIITHRNLPFQSDGNRFME